MLVRSWMQADPITIAPHTLVGEAKRLLTENNLHALPVVAPDGRLRGLVTRANLLRMDHFVARMQDPDEFNYFVTRVRVRDIMVRSPSTVQAGDTMQHCLRKGRQLGVAQFPVLEGAQVVGVISANEIFQIAAHCLGAWEQGSGVTLATVRLGPGVIGRIAAIAEGAGAVLHGLYPVSRRDETMDAGNETEKRLVVRFLAGDAHDVARALAAAGFELMAEDGAPRPALAA